MASQATITAKSGPNVAVTAQVVSNIQTYTVDPVGKKLFVTTSDQPNRVLEYDINAVTTFTTSISGGNYTLTIS